MKLWLTRDGDGSPVLWAEKPYHDVDARFGTAWSGRADLYDGAILLDDDVRKLTGHYHGCRKGGIVELELTVTKTKKDKK